jgi:hypothetical protein
MKFQLLIVSAFLAGLTACGGGSSTDEPATAATTTPATTTAATPTPEPVNTTTPTPTPAPAGNLPTYGPVVTVVNGVNYCKRPLTDEEWGAISGGRPESERASLYRLSPCTS